MNLYRLYKQYWKSHKLLMLSFYIMCCSLLLTNFLVGNKPVLCKYKEEWHALVFHSKPEDGSNLLSDLNEIAQFDYQKLQYDFVIWPLIKLDPKKMESESAWFAPFSKNKKGDYYILGSYDLGRDVLAGCIYGLHKSLLLSIWTILISGILGIFIGSVFSFQSQRFRNMSLLSVIFFVIFLFLFLYTVILFVEWKGVYVSSFLCLILIQLICIGIGIYFLDRTPQLSFKMDFVGLRYIEIMKSIPVILILLMLLQIVKSPNTFSLSCLISLVYIPIIAKYARAFTLSSANEMYIDSIIAIGQTGSMLYIKHILPKLISEIIPILAFGVANIILLEASLSFLGLGMPIDEISLGNMMYTARSNPSAWWVVVFPGFLVFWLVLSFNALGELVSNRKNIRDYQL